MGPSELVAFDRQQLGTRLEMYILGVWYPVCAHGFSVDVILSSISPMVSAPSLPPYWIGKGEGQKIWPLCFGFCQIRHPATATFPKEGGKEQAFQGSSRLKTQHQANERVHKGRLYVLDLGHSTLRKETGCLFVSKQPCSSEAQSFSMLGSTRQVASGCQSSMLVEETPWIRGIA